MKRRTPREAFAEALIILAVCVGAWFFVVDDRSTTLRTLEAQIEQAASVPTTGVDAAIARFAEEAKAMRQRLVEIDRRNRFASDASFLYDTLMSYARACDVHVQRLSPSPSRQATRDERIDTSRMFLTVEAEYGRLAEFLAGLADIPAFIRPASITITPIADRPGVCSATIDAEIVSFRIPEALRATLEEADDAQN